MSDDEYGELAAIDSELARIIGIHSVLSIYIGSDSTGLLSFCHYMKSESSFTGTFRAIDFDDTPPRNASYADRCIKTEGGSRNRRHIRHLTLAQTHNRSLPKFLFDI